jgi:NhaP-type Na+/H+ or K+/H+ antiporter
MVAQAVAAVCLTVLFSVVLHGVSAGPLGRWYVRFEPTADDEEAPRSRAAHTATRSGG